MSSKHPVRRAPRYVAEVDEGGLGAVDAVRVGSRTSNLWLDASRDLRSRRMFWVYAVVLLFLIVVALFPTLLTQVTPNDECYLEKPNGPPVAPHPPGSQK